MELALFKSLVRERKRDQVQVVPFISIFFCMDVCTVFCKLKVSFAVTDIRHWPCNVAIFLLRYQTANHEPTTVVGGCSNVEVNEMNDYITCTIVINV